MPTSHRTQSAVTGGTNRTNSKQDMKIALIGYGKMGHMIEEIARQRGHEIVSIIDVNNQDDFDSPEFASADVAIEFTNPTAAYGNYLKAFSHGVKVVSGSTGWMKDHKDDVVNLTKDALNPVFSGITPPAPDQERRQHPLLGFQLQHRRGHLLGRQPLSGQDYEPV